MRLSGSDCQVCGYVGVTAVWHGSGHTIAICGQCARHVLPALLADAIDHPASAQRVREIWRDGERYFLRAMLSRLLSDSTPTTGVDADGVPY